MTPAALYQRGQEVCHRGDLLRREGEGMRREAIQRALAETGGNQTEAAKLLGIKRTALVAMTRRDRQPQGDALRERVVGRLAEEVE